MFIFMSISSNTHQPYVCDPLGPYISLANDASDLLTLIGLAYHLIDRLIDSLLI